MTAKSKTLKTQPPRGFILERHVLRKEKSPPNTPRTPRHEELNKTLVDKSKRGGKHKSKKKYLPPIE